MKQILFIAFFAALPFFTGLQAQERWALVYENDAQGNTVSGQIDDLIAAVRSGQSIRIYFRMGRPTEPEIFVEHTAEIFFSTVMNSPSGAYVMGQIEPITGQVPDFEAMSVQLKENLEWSLIASITGLNDTMTRHMITGEIVSHKAYRWGTRWFVERPE